MTRQEIMQCYHACPVYGITAASLSAGRSNLEVVKAMLEGGVRFIQYREKEKTGLERYEECLQLRRLTREYGAALIIDDFVDLAIAVDADGVHVGQDDLPPQVVRQLLGPDKLIGYSTHSPEQLQQANEIADVIDYLGVGPVFPTRTKQIANLAGLEYASYAAQHSRLPFVAIGGIKDSNAGQVRAAGVKTIAVVSGLTMAEDIPAMVKKLSDIMLK